MRKQKQNLKLSPKNVYHIVGLLFSYSSHTHTHTHTQTRTNTHTQTNTHTHNLSHTQTHAFAHPHFPLDMGSWLSKFEEVILNPTFFPLFTFE